MRVAILGDIHANATALARALAVADEGGYDSLVLLGDLLTYGCDVVETLDLVDAQRARRPTVLLRGNHDALYDALLTGTNASEGRLPEWIRESVTWTLDRLSAAQWQGLPFRDEYTIQRTLFSHANPFGPAQWAYVNSGAEYEQAAQILRERSFHSGVFGHTHRARRYRTVGGRGTFVATGDGVQHGVLDGVLDGVATHIVNPGAIGQPRDCGQCVPIVCWLTFDGMGTPGEQVQLTSQKARYDVPSHLARLRASGLSAPTVARVSAFFVAPDIVFTGAGES